MNVNFYGMSIEVRNAITPAEAHARLCAVLRAAGFDWTTDGYQIEAEGQWQDEGSTNALTITP